MKQKIAFIVNPVSGNNDKSNIPNTILSILDKNKYRGFEVVFTEYQGHGTLLAKSFLADDFDIVVAVGGDGTVNEVGRALVGSKAALGVISTGSGNGLARHLHIPMNMKKAIEQLNFSEAINIDYGLVNEEPFFCTAGTGFDAYVSKKFENTKKRGVIGYLEKMVSGYLKYTPEHYELIGKGIGFQGKAFVITFANASQWGNNAYIAPDASVQDGLMDISIISNVPVIAIASIAFELFTKSIQNDLFYSSLRTNSITLKRDKPGPFHLDGEPRELGSEINIEIVPDGLKVLVKKRF